MKIKPGVHMPGLQLSMRPALIAAEWIWKAAGQELVITSALEGGHSAGSLHYYGLAVDLRTNYFGHAQTEKVAEQLKKVLGKDYDVIVEASHIHVEYDPKGRK